MRYKQPYQKAAEGGRRSGKGRDWAVGSLTRTDLHSRTARLLQQKLRHAFSARCFVERLAYLLLLCFNIMLTSITHFLCAASSLPRPPLSITAWSCVAWAFSIFPRDACGITLRKEWLDISPRQRYGGVDVIRRAHSLWPCISACCEYGRYRRRRAVATLREKCCYNGESAKIYLYQTYPRGGRALERRAGGIFMEIMSWCSMGATRW